MEKKLRSLAEAKQFLQMAFELALFFHPAKIGQVVKGEEALKANASDLATSLPFLPKI